MYHATDHAELNLMIRGFQVSRMLRLVADLSIADRFPHRGETDIAALAAACGVLGTPLLRVLRALAAFGVFRVTAAGGIGHTPMSLLLRADAPQSLRPAALALAAPGSWGAWNELDAALTGEVPHRRAWNIGRFEYLREHPDEGRDFDLFMGQDPSDRHAAVAAACDFPGTPLIADIGGGNGALLRCILARSTHARGLVFDRAEVVSAIASDGLMDGRLATAAGNFFDHVPAGADHYLLVRVLHDWPDEDCVRILRNCRAAMHDGARLLVVERILETDPAKGQPIEYLGDMQMMAMFGNARERTQAEFSALLNAAGFEVIRLGATASSAFIIEAEVHVSGMRDLASSPPAGRL